jgi:hypothetical protein
MTHVSFKASGVVVCLCQWWEPDGHGGFYLASRLSVDGQTEELVHVSTFVKHETEFVVLVTASKKFPSFIIERRPNWQDPEPKPQVEPRLMFLDKTHPVGAIVTEDDEALASGLVPVEDPYRFLVLEDMSDTHGPRAVKVLPLGRSRHMSAGPLPLLLPIPASCMPAPLTASAMAALQGFQTPGPTAPPDKLTIPPEPGPELEPWPTEAEVKAHDGNWIIGYDLDSTDGGYLFIQQLTESDIADGFVHAEDGGTWFKIEPGDPLAVFAPCDGMGNKVSRNGGAS